MNSKYTDCVGHGMAAKQMHYIAIMHVQLSLVVFTSVSIVIFIERIILNVV